MTGIVSSWINTRLISHGADPFFSAWECLMSVLLGERLIQRIKKKYRFFFSTHLTISTSLRK